MTSLKDSACTECRVDAQRVTEIEVAELMAHIPEWHIQMVDGESRLVRCYKFENFKESLAFTNQIGELAEAQQHHPEILTEWGKVTISWWTHKIKGLHRNDFILAAKTEDIANG